MQEILHQESLYNIDSINAFITDKMMIPGKTGRKINLLKSYQKMKSINSINETEIKRDKANKKFLRVMREGA